MHVFTACPPDPPPYPNIDPAFIPNAPHVVCPKCMMHFQTDFDRNTYLLLHNNLAIPPYAHGDLDDQALIAAGIRARWLNEHDCKPPALPPVGGSLRGRASARAGAGAHA